MEVAMEEVDGFGRSQWSTIFWITITCWSVGPMWAMQLFWGETPGNNSYNLYISFAAENKIIVC